MERLCDCGRRRMSGEDSPDCRPCRSCLFPVQVASCRGPRGAEAAKRRLDVATPPAEQKRDLRAQSERRMPGDVVRQEEVEADRPVVDAKLDAHSRPSNSCPTCLAPQSRGKRRVPPRCVALRGGGVLVRRLGRAVHRVAFFSSGRSGQVAKITVPERRGTAASSREVGSAGSGPSRPRTRLTAATWNWL